jgi:DNA invertase Pin-like site-specific DNA recombinase
MPRKLTVAVYVRVSTDEQSPDAQLRDLRAYLRIRGWHGATEYVDIGESGAKDSRPAWNQLWDQIRKRKINVLVTHALDRLGRSLPHLVKTISTLTECNITLVSYRENLGLSTAQGRMLADLFWAAK